MSIFQRADGKFDWDEHTQGLILGSFFYGLTCMQLGAGWLSDRVGGKRVFGYGMLCFSVLTIITPWVARAGVPHLVTLRVVQGVTGVSDLRWQWSGIRNSATGKGWGDRGVIVPPPTPHPPFPRPLSATCENSPLSFPVSKETFTSYRKLHPVKITHKIVLFKSTLLLFYTGKVMRIAGHCSQILDSQSH